MLLVIGKSTLYGKLTYKDSIFFPPKSTNIIYLIRHPYSVTLTVIRIAVYSHLWSIILSHLMNFWKCTRYVGTYLDAYARAIPNDKKYIFFSSLFWQVREKFWRKLFDMSSVAEICRVQMANFRNVMHLNRRVVKMILFVS